MASPVKDHKKHVIKNIKFAILLVSDSRFQELKENKPSSDKSLALIEGILKENDQILVKKVIVPDVKEKIIDIINEFTTDETIDIIISTGGTGISPRDVTYEAINPLLDKRIDGFGELFRQLSYLEIGSAAMLSRAFSGVIKDKVIFCLPGSPNACKLALEKLILKEAGHALKMIGKVGGK